MAEFSCPDCPKVFKTAVGLGSHSKAHKPLIKCNICGEDHRNIEAHRRKAHQDETANSDTERLLRTDNQRLREMIERRDREITRLKGKLAQVIRGGPIRA